MLARLYRDGGQTATLGTPPILLPLGRGLGGTTLVNSGTCFRTPPRVLDRWHREFGLRARRATLRPCFERVERALSVARGDTRARRRERGGRPARRRAARLVARLPAAQRARLRRLGRVRVRLPDLGQAAHRHHLHPARRGGRGADRHRRRRARGAASRAARARGVRARLAGGGRLEVRAPTRRSSRAARSTRRCCSSAAGCPTRSGQRGRNLALHPATAAFALMDEVVDMARGVPQSFYVDEFAAEGIMFEGVAGPPAYAAMSLPLTGDAPRARDGRLPPARAVRPDGQRLLARPRARGRRAPADPLRPVRRATWRRSAPAWRACGELFLAAGAREVYLPAAARRRARSAPARATSS